MKMVKSTKAAPKMHQPTTRRRRGVERLQLQAIQEAHRFIFSGPGVFAARVAEARNSFGTDSYVVEMLDFIANPSRHGLITTVAGASSEGEG